MSYFYWVRKSLNYTPSQMSEHCQVSRQTLSDFESGRSLPPRELLDKMELDGYPCAEYVLSAREMKKWRRGYAYDLPMLNSECWLKAEKRWSAVLEALKLSRAMRRWLRQFVASDSAWEVLVLSFLAALEARSVLANPHHRLDFRGQPIVDSFGRALGDRVLPGFMGKSGPLQFLLWPQVYLRTSVATYRVDALVMVKMGSKVTWFVLEIDGPHHNPERDRLRCEALGLPEVRLTQTEIEGGQVVPKFVREAQRLLKESGIAA